MSDESSRERFFAKVLPEALTGCWFWTGCTEAGYGRFHLGTRVSKRTVRAHRFSYEIHFGAIPSGMEIDHKCRHTTCVNPAHLEAVTGQENNRRKTVARGHSLVRGKRDTGARWKETHCRSGHLLSGDNVVVLSRGERRCRVCHASRQRKARLK